MRRAVLVLALLALLRPGASARAQDQGMAPPPSDPRALSYPPLAISFPKPEKLFLPNGLLIYLFEDHELPLLDLAFYVKAGSIYDPADRIGLAEMGALMMRTGGTSDMSPDEVDQALDGWDGLTVHLDDHVTAGRPALPLDGHLVRRRLEAGFRGTRAGPDRRDEDTARDR